MIQVLGLDDIYTNIMVLAATQNQRCEFENWQDLEKDFHGFLSYYQPEVPRSQSCGLSVVTHDKTEECLANLFTVQSALNDRGQSDVIGDQFEIREKEIAISQIKEALSHMKSNIGSVYKVLDLIIDFIFFEKI